MKDAVFASPFENLGPFQFNDDVAQVFPDMIRRSVPGYGQMVGGAGLLAARYAQPDSHLYDLGTSLGATALSMARHVQKPNTQILAIDNSQAMIERAGNFLSESRSEKDRPIQLIHGDVLEQPIENASVSVLNLTLQFLPYESRAGLIQRIYRNTRPGGVLLLAEKVTFADPEQAEWAQECYWDFKRANGYSELEIAQKRTALENVLVPETPEDHENRLREAGFKTVRCWFQTLNFMAWIAIK